MFCHLLPHLEVPFIWVAGPAYSPGEAPGCTKLSSSSKCYRMRCPTGLVFGVETRRGMTTPLLANTCFHQNLEIWAIPQFRRNSRKIGCFSSTISGHRNMMHPLLDGCEPELQKKPDCWIGTCVTPPRAGARFCSQKPDLWAAQFAFPLDTAQLGKPLPRLFDDFLCHHTTQEGTEPWNIPEINVLESFFSMVEYSGIIPLKTWKMAFKNVKDHQKIKNPAIVQKCPKVKGGNLSRWNLPMHWASRHFSASATLLLQIALSCRTLWSQLPVQLQNYPWRLWPFLAPEVYTCSWLQNR